jgi:TetR/AcrR family acrAB operon transcriptional repressor
MFHKRAHFSLIYPPIFGGFFTDKQEYDLTRYDKLVKLSRKDSMGKASKSENKTREKRILDATARLLLRYGYDKMTMSDIAEEAGISKGAIYLHYTSKETLVDGLINRQTIEYADEIMTILEADTDNWSFIGLYRHAIAILPRYPLLTGLIRTSKEIFGSYFQRTALDMMKLKRRSRPEMLKMMQQAGVIRADLDIKLVAYTMDYMAYGLLNVEDIVPTEEAPPFGDVVNFFAEIMEKTLIPPDGGNQEAGRAIIMQLISAYKAQLVAQEESQASKEME